MDKNIVFYDVNTYVNSGTTMYDMHIHDTYEFYCLDTDNVQVAYEDRAYIGKKGDVFIFHPFCFHKITANNMIYKRHICHFQTEPFIELSPCLSEAFNYLASNKPFYVHLEEEEMEPLRHLVKNCYNSYVNNSIMYYFKNVCALGNLLEYIINIHRRDNNVNGGLTTLNRPISKILEYISQNYNRDLTIEHISSKFGISQSKLYVMFKESVDMSFKEYLIRLRITRAMPLLKKGMSVTEVSNMVGFNSYAHFIRTFTDRMGISPKKYGGKAILTQTKEQ